MKSALLYVLIFPALSQAIETANYTSATNDRFANDPSFVGAGFDWSGVGRSSDGRWATLLGDNYFITADHFEPDVGTNVSFIAGNSLTSPTFTYAVAGRIPIAGTDLVVSYFDHCVDSSIARYDYTTTAADSLADTGLAGETLFMSGDKVAGAAGSVADHIVGTNQAESWREDGSNTMQTPENTVLFGSSANFDELITFETIPGDTSNTFEFYESQLQGGDSGSPLFSTSGTDLILQGLGYAIANDLPGNFIDTPGPAGSIFDPFEDRDATFYSYVGSYATDIDTAIASVPVCTIPEPTTLSFSLLASLPLLRHRRK
jgi:hypothetical protein